jgi:hypothetical protein
MQMPLPCEDKSVKENCGGKAEVFCFWRLKGSNFGWLEKLYQYFSVPNVLNPADILTIVLRLRLERLF